MRELRWDESEVMTDAATSEKVSKALADERNRVVELHRVGSEVTRSNGRRYRVNEHGQWVRIDVFKRRP